METNTNDFNIFEYINNRPNLQAVNYLLKTISINPNKRSFRIMNEKEQEKQLISELKNSGLNILTNKNCIKAITNITEEERKKVLYFEGGILFIDEKFKTSAEVNRFNSFLVRKKYPLLATIFCPVSVINDINLSYEEFFQKSKSDNTTNEQNGNSYLVDILEKAMKKNTTDIHLSNYSKEAILKFRIDGDMEKIETFDLETSNSILQAAFSLSESQSSTTYTNKKQINARISRDIARSRDIILPRGINSLRLQFNPGINTARQMVIRILPEPTIFTKNLTPYDLGYNDIQIKQINKMLRKPHGMNIIAGATNSGKSTTLKTILEDIMVKTQNTMNLITIEDPPEYIIEGAFQIPVMDSMGDNKKRAEAFNDCIRAALRSDPDIIMIGEMRDAASCENALRASMTGHQVWSTIHANNAIGILTRLRDEGIEIYKTADPSVTTGLIAQTLVKKICPHCKVNYLDALKSPENYDIDLEDEVTLTCTPVIFKDRMNSVFVAKKSGCSECGHRGYKGRTVVAEVLLTDGSFMNFILNGKFMEAHDYWLSNLDGLTLTEHGCQKIYSGKCSPFTIPQLDSFDKNRIELVFGDLNLNTNSSVEEIAKNFNF